VFRIEYDVFVDTTKARRHGFHDVVDTEEMFERMFRDLRDRKMIPDSGATLGKARCL
jgi:hypothetical protein